MANTITETIDQEDPAAVVLFMMDGSVFYTRGQDGSRTLPRRGEDGKFHIEGDLIVCSQEIQAEHLNTMKPILDAVGRRPCIVISPMPRYVVEGCCQDPEHVKNRGERYFRDNMQRQLDGVARSIKNFLFKTHRRNMRVLESSYNIRNLPNVDIWFTDPVHPIDSVYNNLAAGVIKMAATLRDLESRQDLKRRRADSWGRPWIRSGGHVREERVQEGASQEATTEEEDPEETEEAMEAISMEGSVAQGDNPGHRSKANRISQT
jgi:hypothetical protein